MKKKKKKQAGVIHVKVPAKRKGARTKVLCAEKKWESCTDAIFAVNCEHCLSLLEGQA